MTSKNKEMLVSSSFEGRDKSLIKSILNINNQYGDLTLSYTDDPLEYEVYLTGNDQHYCAKIMCCQSIIPIGPELNPKTAISFFNRLAESKVYDASNQKTKKHLSIVEHIYKYLDNESDELMEIRDGVHLNGFHMILDGKNKQVYCDHPLTDDFLLFVSNVSDKDLRINFICCSKNHLMHSMPLTDFKWRLGRMFNDDVLDFDYKSKKYIIKLLVWPDYGHFSYQKEYLQLSSLLFKHQLTYAELIKHTDIPEQIVFGFLNANILLSCLTLVPNENKRLKELNFKTNEFIRSVKAFFLHALSYRS